MEYERFKKIPSSHFSQDEKNSCIYLLQLVNYEYYNIHYSSFNVALNVPS